MKRSYPLERLLHAEGQETPCASTGRASMLDAMRDASRAAGQDGRVRVASGMRPLVALVEVAEYMPSAAVATFVKRRPGENAGIFADGRAGYVEVRDPGALNTSVYGVFAADVAQGSHGGEINALAVKIEQAARLLWGKARGAKQEEAARGIINGAQVIARFTSEVQS